MEFRLGHYQGLPLLSLARFRVTIAGRRFGKTHKSRIRLFQKAVNLARSWSWYIAPTYRMAKDIMWEPLKECFPKAYLRGKPNESELSLRLRNGSLIQLKGADNPDSLRGPGLDLAVFDEFATIKPAAWDVLRPALSDKMGEADFNGSPAGYNWAYDLWTLGQPGGSANWESWQFTTLQGGRVPASEIEEARQQLDPRTFRQEYLASFETLKGRVYDQFDRREWPHGNIRSDIEDYGGTLYVGMDFNVNPMSAVVVQKVQGRPEILTAFEIETSNTQEMADALRARYPERRLVICPDASGARRSTNAPVGQTDFTLLRNAGFDVRAADANPAVKDRINNVQSNLCNAAGDRRCTAHPSILPLLGKALEGLTYKDGTNLPDKSSGLDHICDALGYVLWTEFNVLAELKLVAPESGTLYSPYGGLMHGGEA